MRKIKLLPDKVINQIAAGEVVDRPASVVKELVENAIDAASTSITVEMVDGGKTQIKVIDNGFGMDIDDLKMCIERHATSKLDIANINMISSLGFRGEALPSIASVSNMKITTKQLGDEHGWVLEVRGGVKSELKPASCQVGTTIEVSDLFSYLPARLKFLKSDNTESSYIISIIEELALYYKDINFKLVKDGQTILNLEACSDVSERMDVIFGEGFAENMVPISYNSELFGLEGLVGLPTFTQKTGAFQKVFINGRIVKEKQILSAIKAAYSNIMFYGFYPAVVLYLTFDPFDVDVNVHPAKTEVRLRDPNRVRGALISAIRNTLQSAPAKVANTIALPERFNETIRTSKYQGQQSFSDYKPSTSLSLSNTDLNPVKHTTLANIIEQEIGQLGYAIAQIDNTYIIAESAEGLVIVDQHAAHERLTLELIRSSSIISQSLLIPVVVDLGASMSELVLDNLGLFGRCGFELSRNGITQVVVRAAPTILAYEAIEESIKEAAVCLKDVGDLQNLESQREYILGNIACHSSIRAGRKLTIPEMNAILRQIEQTPLASQCNHGRPTFIKLSAKRLASIFLR